MEIDWTAVAIEFVSWLRDWAAVAISLVALFFSGLTYATRGKFIPRPFWQGIITRYRGGISPRKSLLPGPPAVVEAPAQPMPTGEFLSWGIFVLGEAPAYNYSMELFVNGKLVSGSGDIKIDPGPQHIERVIPVSDEPEALNPQGIMVPSTGTRDIRSAKFVVRWTEFPDMKKKRSQTFKLPRHLRGRNPRLT